MKRSKLPQFADILFRCLVRILTVLFLFVFATLSLSVFSQHVSADEQNEPSSIDELPNPWHDIDVVIQSLPAERLIVPTKYRLLAADIDLLDDLLSRAPAESTVTAQNRGTVLLLPLPDGTFAQFRVEESSIMDPALAARYPEIRTYRGVGIDDPTATARLDRTPAGFHGFILSSSDTIYIDPYQRGDIAHYMSYYKRDYSNPRGKPFSEDVIDATEGLASPESAAIARSGPTLRTYRLACRCKC